MQPGQWPPGPYPPGAWQQPPGYGYGYPPYRTGPAVNPMAVAALVLGVIGWILLIGPVLAIIFGTIGLGQIRRSAGAQRGRGMAIAGIVLGGIQIGLFLLLLVVGLATSTNSGLLTLLQ